MGKQTASNKRAKQRKNLIYFPQVFLVGSQEELGRIVDITTEGFLLVRRDCLSQGSRFRVRIVWKAGPDGREDSLECTAEACWCRPDQNPELQAVGCRIVAIDPADKAEISLLISQWSFPEW